MRTYAAKVAEAQQDAISTVNAMTHAYQGNSQETFTKKATELTRRQYSIFELIGSTAEALIPAAQVIAELKTAAIEKLAVLAAQRAVAAAEAAALEIDSAARDLCVALKAELTQYVNEELVDTTIMKLIIEIEASAGAFTFHSSDIDIDTDIDTGAADAESTASPVGDSFMIVSDALRRLAGVMPTHADTISQHADTFVSDVSALTFR
jgi:uncharacterized protein YukE